MLYAKPALHLAKVKIMILVYLSWVRPACYNCVLMILFLSLCSWSAHLWVRICFRACVGGGWVNASLGHPLWHKPIWYYFFMLLWCMVAMCEFNLACNLILRAPLFNVCVVVDYMYLFMIYTGWRLQRWLSFFRALGNHLVVQVKLWDQRKIISLAQTISKGHALVKAESVEWDLI